ncbi:MAG: MFS transporter [Verrucomicrobia bacterium]|nr:MAG: MFS transporter [Verrucomicrobiota bacterium]
MTAPLPTAPEKKGSVFDGVTFYHWMVVIVASAGWLFDCMDQRLFVLARESALKEMLAGNADALANLKAYIGTATTSMILGWATGGIIFGMMSDKIGRVKTMVATLLTYSIFTGLCGLAHSWQVFTLYRFLVGLGVGGMFGAATTLVAESVPGNFRSMALGSLQALSATGNIMGSAISIKIPPGMENFWGDMAGWRVLFFVGILPAILVAPIVIFLREPEAWKQARQHAREDSSRSMGSVRDLFAHRRWRHHTIIGLLLGVSGMVGLWGIGFFSPELVSEALKGEPQEVVDRVRSIGTLLQDVGSFTGMLTFTFVASYLSRRIAFLGAFALCLVTTIFVFYSLNSASDAYWMLPMMGFAQLAVFAGYSIYFPELFPTRLRGTGVGFCYNTVRYLAAPAPMLLGYLSRAMSFRSAAIVMAFIYVVGMVALIWAPETKGQPLPEEDLPAGAADKLAS